MNNKLIQESIETLEKADIGSEYLDLMVMESVGLIPSNCRTLDVINGLVLWELEDGEEGKSLYNQFTTSLDATEYVFNGRWVWESMQQNDDGCWDCCASLAWGLPKVDTYNKSLPIARTIVWLKSLQDIEK